MKFIFLIILLIRSMVFPGFIFAFALPPGNNPTNPTGALTPLQAWYAPDGSSCNLTNYITYFSQTNCTGQAGFVTQGISPQSPCSVYGQGKCFQVGGNAFVLPARSSWELTNQTCIPITPAAIPPNAFDTLYNCRFGIPPQSEVNGTVTVNFTNHQQFDKIFVWLTDTKDNFSRPFELIRNQIINNQPYQYSFPNLFADKKYDIWVKAYGPGGVFLDNVTYDSSCGLSACRIIPSAQIDFILTFPNLQNAINLSPGINTPGQTTAQITNDDFQRMIELWINGQINPVGISLFIEQLSRVPGLQQTTCDPQIPGGCLP